MSASSTAVMSSASATTSSASGYGSAFWERLWRTSGLQFVGLFIVAYAF